jgi:hypothetical protein
VRVTVEGGAQAWVATRAIGVGEEIVAPVVLMLDEAQQQQQRDALPGEIFATLALYEHAHLDYFNSDPAAPPDRLLIASARPVLEYAFERMKTTLTVHALMMVLPFIDTLMCALQSAGEDLAAEREELATVLMSMGALVMHLIKKNRVANEYIVYAGRPLLAALLACHAGRAAVPSACNLSFQRAVRLAAASVSFVPAELDPFSSLLVMGDVGVALHEHLAAVRASIAHA